MSNFDLKKYLVENNLTSNSYLSEEATTKFYISFTRPNGEAVTLTDDPKDTYEGALSSIRTLIGYASAAGIKKSLGWSVSDKDGNPIDEDGNTIE
jgi:hypothetical protein